MSLTHCTPSSSKLYNQKPAFYSYIIGDVNNQHIHAAYAIDAYITPASCQKTITALLALKTLGPDFRYKTKVFFNPNSLSKKQNIQDVIISFDGDPNLTSDNLLTLLAPIKNKKLLVKLY